MRPISTKRRGQSGFALLLVFLMAAIAALMLYRELPRVAFQSQRQKEQILMERGEEYKHAIGIFMRTNGNRWPASIEELESFNNKRSLRRRYIDPMTGKDEWRLIHISNGVLQDSITNKPPATQQNSNGPGLIAEVPLMQQNNTTGGVNPALRRRPSDGGPQLGPDGQPIGPNPANGFGAMNGGFPGTPGFPGATGTQGAPGATGPTNPNPGLPNMAAFPGGVAPTPGNGTNGVPGAPGLPGANGAVTGVPGMLGIPTAPGQTPGQTGQNNQANNNSGGGGMFGSGSGGGLFGSAPTTTPTAGANAQQGVPGQNGVPGQPGLPGQAGVPGQSPFNGQFGQPGMTPGASLGAGSTPVGINPQAQAAAANMLQTILTTPRPGGLAGVQSAQTQSGNAVGQGIAGFASKFDADSIMLYNDKQNYAEWEFIYDPSKYRPPPQPTSSVGLGTANTGGIFGGGSTSGGSSSSSSNSSSPSPAAPTPGATNGATPMNAAPTGMAGGAAPSPFGNSFSSGAPGGATASGLGSPSGVGTPMGTSPMGTPGMPGAQGVPGQPVTPGGSSAFGGGGGIDIRPGRAN